MCQRTFQFLSQVKMPLNYINMTSVLSYVRSKQCSFSLGLPLSLVPYSYKTSLLILLAFSPVNAAVNVFVMSRTLSSSFLFIQSKLQVIIANESTILLNTVNQHHVDSAYRNVLFSKCH